MMNSSSENYCYGQQQKISVFKDPIDDYINIQNQNTINNNNNNNIIINE